MKVRNAIKKVKSHFKKQGINIKISSPVKGGYHKWTFQHGDYIGSFSVNGYRGWEPEALDGDALSFHVRRSDDHSDSMTDYFAGSYRSNITQVCEALLPSPPKYTVGSLVRGKQTKRAHRTGFAGKVGLVMSARSSSSIQVKWLGEPDKPAAGWAAHNYYSSRDLEVAASN